MQQTIRIAFGLLSLVVEVACETVVVAVCEHCSDVTESFLYL